MSPSRTKAVEEEKLSQPTLFSSGQELANLAVSSGLLKQSWVIISELYDEDFNQSERIRYKVYQESNCSIVAFVTSPTCTKQLLQQEELVASKSLPLFHLLCSKRTSSFSIHKAAETLFASLHDQLSILKTQLGNTTPLITGHSLGGSVASLFALWLLEGVNKPGAKRPLCITFGAPLLGDKGLQEAISHSSLWNSCFLHVAANLDSVPRLFISPQNPNAMEINSQNEEYKPFGTFLLCSDSGYTCVEDPEAVSQLLNATGLVTARFGNASEGWQTFDYGSVVEHLMSMVEIKGISQLGESTVDTLRAGIILQLEAIGVSRAQPNSGNKELIEEIERREKRCLLKKKRIFDPFKKLNDIKIYMTKLEWYKKNCVSDKTGYYDSYKNRGSLHKDIEVNKFKRYLNIYWEKMVAEAEKIPQTEEAAFMTRWLYGGTNYRRMVEPLDIADYYQKGLRDYKTEGRSQHYIRLEQWLEKARALDSKNQNVSSALTNSKKQNVSAILTEDSCFWARVEEALILCKFLKSDENRESTRSNLIEFEEYVMQQMKNYAVSPEIFLEGSSFMKWWREYEEIMGPFYTSQLTHFMKNRCYHQYAKGSWVLS